MKRKWSRYLTLCLFSMCTVAATCIAAAAEEDSFWKLQQRLDQDFRGDMNEAEKDWDEFENAQRAKWAKFQDEVEKKWQAFVSSTERQWVDYDATLDTRSKVDFEQGKIEVETLVSKSDADGIKKAIGNILSQLKTIFGKKTDQGQGVLENQVKDDVGRVVTGERLEAYFAAQLTKKIEPDPEPVQSRDGETRQRYSVKFDLVPEHLDIRARKYVPLVQQNAERFGLAPELIMAMIHTESYFNPLAVSSAGAIGLIQIIPRYAGREAYRFLYAQDWIILPEYLYSPGINLELGSAYLHLLKTRHFKELRGLKNRYVSICGYNWGPTAIRKKILNRYNVSSMSDTEFFKLLQQKTPEETSKYLANVTKRMGIYKAYFQ